MVRGLKRPEATEGYTRKVVTACGKLYITLNFVEGKPFEVFLRLGKGGGCFASNMEGISRTISKALQAGEDIKEIIEQLGGIRCDKPVFSHGEQIMSCSDALSKSLSHILDIHSKARDKKEGEKK